MKMKKIGVVADFLISLSGVLIIKHEQTLGFLSILLSSYCSYGLEICSTKSIGLRSFLSLLSREAPRIKSERTGRVLRKDSTLFTDKCKGV